MEGGRDKEGQDRHPSRQAAPRSFFRAATRKSGKKLTDIERASAIVVPAAEDIDPPSPLSPHKMDPTDNRKRHQSSRGYRKNGVYSGPRPRPKSRGSRGLGIAARRCVALSSVNVRPSVRSCRIHRSRTSFIEFFE